MEYYKNILTKLYLGDYKTENPDNSYNWSKFIYWQLNPNFALSDNPDNSYDWSRFEVKFKR